ncbi:Trp biosynthesis-associated membrane protein [Aeromicrobium sp. A1-2]|uniref:Trp biosynthesis-associated membrane protein n=1 Tax=Aeromicrobium sp. A1-2 TaxID=2107713 RepID=UPI0013C31F9D|nr:Trp biosynthesis-associated membrane protein [Aeromicrobium sp. A1-2]
MNTRRLLAPTVLGTVAAGGLAFFAASRTWAHVRVATDGLPSDSVDVTGTDAQPLVSALALVVLTAALAVLAASPRVRRVVGGFTVLVAAAGVGIVLFGSSALDDAVGRAVEASPAFTGSTAPDFSTSPWAYVTVLGFVLAAVLGGITAKFGATWPTMSSRYDAPAARPVVVTPQSDSDMWKALDEGRDPTQ